MITACIAIIFCSQCTHALAPKPTNAQAGAVEAAAEVVACQSLHKQRLHILTAGTTEKVPAAFEAGADLLAGELEFLIPVAPRRPALTKCVVQASLQHAGRLSVLHAPWTAALQAAQTIRALYSKTAGIKLACHHSACIHRAVSTAGCGPIPRAQPGKRCARGKLKSDRDILRARAILTIAHSAGSCTLHKLGNPANTAMVFTYVHTFDTAIVQQLVSRLAVTPSWTASAMRCVPLTCMRNPTTLVSRFM
jgi:hypothetical protein